MRMYRWKLFLHHLDPYPFQFPRADLYQVYCPTSGEKILES